MTVAHYIEKYIQTPIHERRTDKVFSAYLSNRTGNAIYNGLVCYFDPKGKWDDENQKKADEIMNTKETLCDFLYKNQIDVNSMKGIGKKAVAEMSELFRNIYG